MAGSLPGRPGACVILGGEVPVGVEQDVGDVAVESTDPDLVPEVAGAARVHDCFAVLVAADGAGGAVGYLADDRGLGGRVGAHVDLCRAPYGGRQWAAGRDGGAGCELVGEIGA